MGIFSFLGKKEGEAANTTPDKESLRRKRAASANNATRANNSQVLQRDAALATAKKIDAIESEMTSELVRPAKSRSASAPAKRPPANDAQPAEGSDKNAGPPTKTFQANLPAMGMSTDFLLGGETNVGSVEVAHSETAPIIEEAAILFANDQTDMVEKMLLSSIHDDALGESNRTVWWMLFDLYQITGKQQQFDTLSLDYASKYETSPPGWEASRLEPQSTSATSTAAPSITFSGKLDSNIVKQLDRALKTSETSPTVRLEFSRISEVDPAGCELLLTTLKKLQKKGGALVLVGAADLTLKIRSILEVGRRDETEAPWLLLLEILQLLNREKDFEESSIDYCVTFEVSPPAFVAPKNKITTAVEAVDDLTTPDETLDCYMMPLVIDGRTNVIGPIAEYAASNNPAIIDCTRLTRVDFSAAGQLLSGLAPLAANGRTIELQNVNHLVAALFQVMGLKDIARITPRKY